MFLRNSSVDLQKKSLGDLIQKVFWKDFSGSREGRHTINRKILVYLMEGVLVVLIKDFCRDQVKSYNI